ncbi:MAG TPA: HlyD family secretion protein [Candidatus Acidoferrum sp.]|jgi:membrane fusion protein (multidrug efflux system)
MSAASAPATSPVPQPEQPPSKAKTGWEWLKYATPILVLILAAAVVVTVTRDWNAWEGSKIEQITDDAFVRGDLTPLSTRVPGIVRSVEVSDYQPVHKGDLLVVLQDDDYQAQLAQASAAVEAAKAGIENNKRQQELQDSRIQRALAGIDQAKAQIAAAEAGIIAVHADVVRTSAERERQEALLATQAATKQRVETAVADEQRFAAQAASRAADLEQAKTGLRSNELAVESEQRAKTVLESQQQQLVADLHAKEAARNVAQINLGYTKVQAPADGIVGERQVRPGQLVSPGTQVLTFVAQTKWVQANYRETQLTHMKIGDAAEIRIDQYPGQVVRGKVLEIAPASGSQFALLPPDNATGNFTKVVQRIPVKIALDESALAAQLRPGISVTATVRTTR